MHVFRKFPLSFRIHFLKKNVTKVSNKVATQIAAEVSAPLAKTEEIVLLGGSDPITGEVNRLVSQIPPSIHALTGVDLSKVTCKSFFSDHMLMCVFIPPVIFFE